jgi:hypothetical protein
MISGSLALAQLSSSQAATPTPAPGASQTGTPIKSGAPSTRHDASKRHHVAKGTSGTKHTGTAAKPKGTTGTSKSTSSHATKHKTNKTQHHMTEKPEPPLLA